MFPLISSALMLAIAVALTAVLCRVRATAFLARLRAEQSFLELQKAQASLLLERNAASQSRFAAALSHELNTPLGTLASAFDTLARLIERSIWTRGGRARPRSRCAPAGPRTPG